MSSKGRALLRRHWVEGAALLVAFVYLAFHLHGFSVTRWFHLLGGTVDLDGLRWGRGQSIRSDDWAVSFPLWLSQFQGRAFSAVNPFIGFGQNLSLAPYSIATWSWPAIFSPYVWGFFWDVNHGMSWLWTFDSVGLFTALFLALRRLDPERRWSEGTKAVWAASLVFSPFFQFWSYVPSVLVILGTLACLSMDSLTRARATGPRLWGRQLLQTYLWMAFALFIYPPFQIPFALLMVGLLIHLGRRDGLGPVSRRLGPPAAAFLAILALFVFENRVDFMTLAHTVYPGLREVAGGRGTLMFALGGQLVLLKRATSLAGFGGNVCEAAGFFNFVPFLLPALWLQRAKLDRGARAALPVVTAFAGVYLTWYFFGLPLWLARATGLTRTSEVRSILCWGILNFLLLAFWFRAPLGRARRGLLAGWLLACAAAWALALRQGMLDTATLGRSAPLILFFIAASGLLARRKAGAFAMISLIASLWSTWDFNPLVYGDVIAEFDRQPVVRLIKRTRLAPGEKLAVFGHSPVSEIPRAVGVPSLTGVYLMPDAKLWAILDPSGGQAPIWNRYAYVVFTPAPPGQTPQLSSPQPDVVIVAIDPMGPQMTSLGIRAALVEDKDAPHFGRGYRLEAKDAGWNLFRRL